ncbi:MAG: thermonuclease family protein [Candidatus Nitrosothermus koennekii]|nr:MAG: thermonuclease family protein [Candidatus Nitrosothermus koennekii]
MLKRGRRRRGEGLQIKYLLFLFIIPLLLIYYYANEMNSESNLCKGSAACFYATVVRVMDGDTIDVNYNNEIIRIRLALVDTPERYEPLYEEAKEFTAKLCPIGSRVLIDEDDNQLEGSYGRMIAKVYCNDKILNAELVNNALASIDARFCFSEFAYEEWAKDYC